MGSLLRDQASMPAQNSVRCHDRRELPEQLATDAIGRQPPILIIREPHPPRTDLSPEDAVLLAQVVENLLLLLVQPPGEPREEEDLRGDRRFRGRAA